MFVGLAFWKANSRKLFAVSTICKKERKRKKAAADDEIVSIDTDSDGVSTNLQRAQICHLLYNQVCVNSTFGKHVTTSLCRDRRIQHIGFW